MRPTVGQADVNAHRDQRLLKAANVFDDVQRLSEPDDRIAHQLPRAVPGDFAAAVHVDDGRAVGGPLVGLRAFPGGVHRRVLQQQQGVVATGDPSICELALQLPGGEIVEAAESSDVDCGAARPDGGHEGEVTRTSVALRVARQTLRLLLPPKAQP